MPRELNVALIGYKFMGKAHSHAYRDVDFFFPGECKPVMKVICGRNEAPLRDAANAWGWQECETSWEEVVQRDDIDIVDIASPQNTHRDIAVAAAKAGKHILLEKPMALNEAEAREMLDAVREANVKHMVVFNYRRVPAVAYARRLIEDGKIGRIFHFRACYLQDWIVDEEFPLIWKLRKETAGSGAHGDLNAHLIDLARFLVGEIAEVVGQTHNFITERPLPVETGELSTMLTAEAGAETGQVTVEDTASFLAKFDSGAVGTFEATRFAPGRRNHNRFEIYGSKGSLVFDFERMNELDYYSADDDPGAQGFRTILTTDEAHPYVSAWWPPGHAIGYEHTFVHQVADLLRAIHEDTEPHPNFHDGWKNQQALDAVLRSAESGSRVTISH
jgi:predicted dehydrogenase